MGSCNFKSEIEDTTVSITKSHFQFQYVIGKGGYGKVWKVESKKDRKIYAMKEMSKAKIISKKSVQSVLNEKNLLSQLNHKFIVNMHYAFKDRENLYLVMDLMPGGDLRYHLQRNVFNEAQSKFFICCILLGLEYMHKQCILHRDIKPENLVFDGNGYLHITDLGISRVWSENNAKETSGTPGYMAPEVMCRQNHGVVCDYYAIGVIAYEIMMRSRPYIGNDRREIRDQILSKQVQITKEEIPKNWTYEAADFINKVLFI
jgi:serine/threonine protein kinase